jgi:16S rRNA (guanine527-N7)-methyltransferase
MAKAQKFESLESLRAVFDVSRETATRLETYHALLLKWQKAVQLVAPKTLNEAWHRHFADSAQMVVLAAQVGAPEPKTWVDLGSGGGFPGLVVAILLADRGTKVTLIESDRRKCTFLREVARSCGIAVDIVTERIEAAANTGSVRGVQGPDVVSARALAALSELLDLAFPLFGAGTRGLFMKGREAAVEVEAARQRFAFDAQLLPSVTDDAARIVAVTGLRRV